MNQHNNNNNRLRFSSDKLVLTKLCKTVSVSVLFVYIFIVYLYTNSSCKTGECILPVKRIWEPSKPIPKSSSPYYLQHRDGSGPPTDVSQLVFGITGSVKVWQDRLNYFTQWWRPNVTRGYIFFDEDPTPDILPWPHYFPPFRVSENATRFEVYSRHVRPFVIRIVRVILEMYRERDEGVRWYVLGDDDTVFFVDNLVDMLSRYDHTKYFYIGGISECTKSNFDFSFEMAFGGGGFALSYPLVSALVDHLDECLNLYPFYYVSDQILSACIADLGVPLTLEKGFHQIDLVDDISGFLSAHPQSPLITLHHLDIVLPIFPIMDRHKSVNHLMKAARADQSRLLQQTVCYHKQKNWAFSIAWGYSAYIYEQYIPRSILRRPFETFIPWSLKPRPPDYMFNTRPVAKHPCEAPHLFFFDSVEKRRVNFSNGGVGYDIVTNYMRASPRGLPACGLASADYINKIRVFSSATKMDMGENRGECCDVVHVGIQDTVEVRIRGCMRTEIVA